MIGKFGKSLNARIIAVVPGRFYSVLVLLHNKFETFLAELK